MHFIEMYVNWKYALQYKHHDVSQVTLNRKTFRWVTATLILFSIAVKTSSIHSHSFKDFLENMHKDLYMEIRLFIYLYLDEQVNVICFSTYISVGTLMEHVHYERYVARKPSRITETGCKLIMMQSLTHEL